MEFCVKNTLFSVGWSLYSEHGETVGSVEKVHARHWEETAHWCWQAAAVAALGWAKSAAQTIAPSVVQTE